jgi:Domain of unknown function (DUF4158)
MSASHQLTEQQRTRLLTGHHLLGRREMVRYWLLAEEDIRRINDRRREHNRLGFAIQLCVLRYPGWPLGPEEMPPANLLTFVAEQLNADATEIAEYAARDETRREHVQILCKEYRFGQYGPAHAPFLRAYLETEALSSDSALTSVESATEWLRERRVILPALATLESVVRSVRSKVERNVYWRLFSRLEDSHKRELTKLLELGPSRGSLLGWLRRVPRSCSATGLLDLMQRLNWVRGSGVPRTLAEGIAPNRIDRLAARGGRHSVAHFRRFPPEKRYAFLAAFLLYAAEELTDRSMDFHRRLTGACFAKQKRSTGLA